MQTTPQTPVPSSLRALQKSFLSILGLSVLVGVIAYGAARNIPGTYEVHLSYMIGMDQKDTTSGFRYDGYYALSAADLFSTTLARIADSPETVVAAYEQANIPLPTQDAIRLVRSIESEKAAPQLVRLTVRDASQKNAERIADGLIVVMNKAIDEYNTKGLSSTVFHGVPTEPWTSQNSTLPLPIAASFFMVTFIAGIMWVLFREAMYRGAS